MATLDDIVSNLKNGVVNLGLVATALSNALPRAIGTFGDLGVGTGATTVTEPRILANGFPVFMPSNLSAALTMRANGVYVSSVTAGTGFNINTTNNTAGGGEVFSYVIINPA